MALTLIPDKLSPYPLLDTTYYPSIINRNLPTNQGNFKWAWLPVSGSSILEPHDHGEFHGRWPHWPGLYSSSDSQRRSSSDSLDSEPGQFSTPAPIRPRKRSEDSQSGESTAVELYWGLHRPYTSTSSVFDHGIVQQRRHSMSITVEGDAVKGHDQRPESRQSVPETTSTSNADHFETVDLTAESCSRWAMVQQATASDATPAPVLTINDDYQVVHIPPSPDDRRKRDIVIALVIGGVTIVVVVLVVVVLLTTLLHR